MITFSRLCRLMLLSGAILFFNNHQIFGSQARPSAADEDIAYLNSLQKMKEAGKPFSILGIEEKGATEDTIMDAYVKLAYKYFSYRYEDKSVLAQTVSSIKEILKWAFIDAGKEARSSEQKRGSQEARDRAYLTSLQEMVNDGKPFLILGIEEKGATKETIKKAYRFLKDKYAAFRYEDKGRLAQERADSIREILKWAFTEAGKKVLSSEQKGESQETKDIAYLKRLQEMKEAGTPFLILGLEEKGASKATINKAYRSFIVKYHPDKYWDKTAEGKKRADAIVQIIQWARERALQSI